MRVLSLVLFTVLISISLLHPTQASFGRFHQDVEQYLTATRRSTTVNGFTKSLRSTQSSAQIQADLQNFTDPGEASLFAVLNPFGRVQTWSTGPISSSSIMRFGSVTKIFTGWLALHAGLNLEAHPKHYGYAPVYYSNSSIIKFKQVMSHTAGIPEYAQIQYLVNMTDPNPNNWNWINNGDFTPSLDVDLVWKNVPIPGMPAALDGVLDYVPGTQYCYSNTDCELVGVVVQKITGQPVSQLLPAQFPGLNIDNGTTPLSSWPQTPAYLNWPYPASLPGVSGSLIGNAESLLRGFDRVTKSGEYNTMQTWVYDAVSSTSVPQCPPTAVQYNTAGGQKYGYFMQYYNSSQIWSDTYPDQDGGSIGHDGNLIARTQLIKHPSGNIYVYHYTNQIDNIELQRRTSILVQDHLSYC